MTRYYAQSWRSKFRLLLSCLVGEIDIKTAILESEKLLGYIELKDRQVEAMIAILQTGYGKSLIYADLRYAFDHIDTVKYGYC